MFVFQVILELKMTLLHKYFLVFTRNSKR